MVVMTVTMIMAELSPPSPPPPPILPSPPHEGLPERVQPRRLRQFEGLSEWRSLVNCLLRDAILNLILGLVR